MTEQFHRPLETRRRGIGLRTALRASSSSPVGQPPGSAGPWPPALDIPDFRCEGSWARRPQISERRFEIWSQPRSATRAVEKNTQALGLPTVFFQRFTNVSTEPQGCAFRHSNRSLPQAMKALGSVLIPEAVAKEVGFATPWLQIRAVRDNPIEARLRHSAHSDGDARCRVLRQQGTGREDPPSGRRIRRALILARRIRGVPLSSSAMHHKRKRPKARRAGCLLCKPNKLGHRGFAKGVENELIDPECGDTEGIVARRERLGGLLNYYHHRVA